MTQNLVKIMLIMIVMISVVGAVPPVTTLSQPEYGLDLETVAPINIPTSTFVNITFHIFNSSNGVLLDPNDYTCMGHLYNPLGIRIVDQEGGIDEDSVYFTLNETMAQDSGIYPYSFHCNDTDSGGFFTSYFAASTSGNVLNTPNSVLIVGILLVFLGVAMFFLMFAKNTENPGVKLFLNVISYLLMLLTVGASYITLQSLQTPVEWLGEGLIYIVGVVLIIIMYYIFINLTKQVLETMRAKKGFSSDYDQDATF